MKAIGIVARPDLSDAASLLRELAQWLTARGIEVWLEERTAALADGALPAGIRRAPGPEVGAASDALVVLGGDGTLLRASRLLKTGGARAGRQLRQPRLPHRDHPSGAVRNARRDCWTGPTAPRSGACCARS